MKPAADIPALTGVRFIAALWVVLYHLGDKIAEYAPWAMPAIHGGLYAVPFFFILSGFILAHVYFPTYKLSDHWHFMWLRVARLWPVHLAMFGAMLLYVVCLTVVRGYVPHPKYDFTVALPELAMVRSWYDDRFMWDGPAWSIQIEMFAYLLLFPLCAFAIRPMRNPWLLGALATALLLAHPYAHPLMSGRIGTILFLFPAGCALYRLRMVLPTIPAHILFCLSLAVLLVGVPHLTYFALAAIVFTLSYQQGLYASLLSTRPMVYGGRISFALYMSHIPVNTWTGELWGQLGVDGPCTVVVTFLASLATAAAVYHFIEVPANRWLREREPRFRPVNIFKQATP